MLLNTLTIYNKIIDKYGSEGLFATIKSIPNYLKWKSKKEIIRTRFGFNALTISRHYYHKRKYIHPADPYETIRVSPSEVKYESVQIKKDLGLGQIKNGSWDLIENCKPLEEKVIVRGLYERYEKNYEWEDTVYYEHAKRKFNNGKTTDGCKNIKEFKNIRCGFVDNLYESIRDDGYRANFEEGHKVPETDKVRNQEKLFQHRLEPLVTIGRNGQIYWRDGFHRLTICKILDIESIPVNVLARHEKWQQIRDCISTGKTNKFTSNELNKYKNHPDLHDVMKQNKQLPN